MASAVRAKVLASELGEEGDLVMRARAIERLHDVKHRALGLDKADVFPNELPEIVIRDLTPEELATLSEADETDNDLDEGGGGERN